jgi:two-component system, NtrC family, nitrogen regulation response regulator NtrX
MTCAALPPIVGVSEAIRQAARLVERFAPRGLPILLVGATGTGKELFARYIHFLSRRSGALVDVNCGALPHEIAESLLFGHRRGAFTGAVESVIGHLERAHHGTLFLDEVLHLSLSAQVKLLRVLETGEVQPLGAGGKHAVDFRVVSAAQEDTPQHVDRGLFRHDLYQRLAGVVINLPLLIDRPEDIMPLAEHFAGLQRQVLEPGCEIVLQGYSWPGNVRELRLAIERAGCLVDNGSLPPGALRDAIALGVPKDRRSKRRCGGGRRVSDLHGQISEELEHQLAIFESHGRDARRAAAALEISLSTFYARLQRAGVSMRAVRNHRH